MTKAMPFLQKAILLSYDPRRFRQGVFHGKNAEQRLFFAWMGGKL